MYIYVYVAIYLYICIYVIQGKNNQHFHKNILATPFINSCKLRVYGPKYTPIFTFAFNHTFHLNQLSLQTINAPYFGINF